MDDKLIRQASVTIALVLVSLFQAFVGSLDQLMIFILPVFGDLSERPSGYEVFLVSIFSAFKVGVLILIVERFVFYVVARRYLGRWIYHSTHGNYGVLDIDISGFWAGGITLSYNVSIYKEESQAISACEHKVLVDPYTTAHGLITQLTKSELAVIYDVEQSNKRDWDWHAKHGIVRVKSVPKSQTLMGYWESTIVNDSTDTPDKDIRSGAYTAFRPKEFSMRNRFNEDQK